MTRGIGNLGYGQRRCRRKVDDFLKERERERTGQQCVPRAGSIDAAEWWRASVWGRQWEGVIVSVGV